MTSIDKEDRARSGLLNRMIEFSLRNRLLVVFAIALALFLGLVAFRAMETDLFPDLSSPVITVFVENPGLAAQEGETLIARPLEAAFRSLPNVVKVRSESETGVVSVRTEFRFGIDYYLARQLLAERLAASARDFPVGTAPPVLSSAASRLGEVLLFYVAGDSGKSDTKELKETADYLIRYKLQTVPGVIRITSHGGQRRQYEIALDPERMRSYNLSHHEIVAAVNESNLNFSGGFITGTATEMEVRGLGRINSLDDIANIVVAVRDGVPVRIREVAEVRDGAAVRRGIARVNQQEAVVMTVTKQFGSDTLAVVEQSRQALDELKPFLPEGVSTVSFFDQSELIRVATRTLEEALLVGGVAVVLIIFLFLGNLRSTLIAAITIPVAVVISFTFLHLFQVTLNIMSLGGLAVGLGIMIDAAIVDTENIFRHLQKNPGDSLRATLRGASEVRRPAAYSTAIIIVVFLPLLFLSGLEGKILSPFALTVIVLMAVGLILSLTLTPALCYTLLRKVAPRLKQESWLARQAERVYEPVLRGALRRPVRAVVVAIAIFAGSLITLPFLGTELLPKMDEGSLLVEVSTPSGTSLGETDRIASQVTSVLEGGPDVAAVIQPVGRAERSEDPMPVNTAEIYLQLVPRSQRQHRTAEIESWVREQLKKVPGAATSITTPLNMRIDESISGTSAALTVKVFGSNLDTLAQKGAEVKRLVERVPGIVDVRLEPLEGVPQVVIKVDRERASRFGLNPGEIGHTVESLLGGREVTTVLKDHLKEYPVVMRLHEQYRDAPEKLAQLMIDTPSGQKVALGDIADVRQERGPATIKREDQLRRIQVSMNVQGRDMGSVVQEIEKGLRGVKLPDGYFVSFGGSYARQQELTSELARAFMISALLVFFLLYLAFRSIWQVLLVSATIPLALAGGFIALWITGTTLNVSSIIGLLAHFGLSVQKGLILVEYINQLRSEGYSLYEALDLGARTRLRPVLMTAASAGLGVLPIAIGWGAGAELQQPMAIALIGGLVTSTILTLVALPALYELAEGARVKVTEAWRQLRNAGAESPAPASIGE
ncbi:MAG: heavy metal efflux system protein [Blastocatellia bacterium]